MAGFHLFCFSLFILSFCVSEYSFPSCLICFDTESSCFSPKAQILIERSILSMCVCFSNSLSLGNLLMVLCMNQRMIVQCGLDFLEGLPSKSLFFQP